jgi:hypothetical protein
MIIEMKAAARSKTQMYPFSVLLEANGQDLRAIFGGRS